MVGQGSTTSLGETRTSFQIPADSRIGPRLVTVGIEGGAVTADCIVEVLPLPDCNGNGVNDALDIAVGDSQDLNDNGKPDECELGTVAWIFSGMAQGGQISTTIQGFSAPCTIVLMTAPGQTAAMVAANFAAAINADACLADQEIAATVSGSTVKISGFTLGPDDVSYTSTDSGLQHRMSLLSIPTVWPSGAMFLVLLLAAAGLFLLTRRHT
jgi:hypothetical protein